MEDIQQPADGFMEVIERLEDNYQNHVDASKDEGPFIVNEDMRKLYIQQMKIGLEGLSDK